MKLFNHTSYRSKFILLPFFLLLNYLAFSQGQIKNVKIDSISRLDYDTIQKSIIGKDSLLSHLAIKAYLKKGRKEKDTTRILFAFKRFIYLKNQIHYADSVFFLLRNNKNKKFYKDLSNIYFTRGLSYYNNYEFEKALNCYISAGKIMHGYDIDFNIGLIKNRIGEYREALTLFKKVEKNFIDKPVNGDYLFNVFAIGDAYRHIKLLDSASYYNKLGYNLSLKHDMQYIAPYFVLSEGATNYNKKNYQESVDSLLSVSKAFIKNGDIANLSMAYYFTAMSFNKLKNEPRSIKYLKKFDSLYLITHHIEPEFRNAYELLIKHSHSNNDINGELKYINRLLKVDSSLNRDYRFLAKKLFLEYDSPRLLEDKERIITNFKKNRKISKKVILYAIICIALLGIIVLYYINKNNRNQKRFNELLEHINRQQETNTKEPTIPKENSAKTQKLNINQNVIDDILIKIEKFEKEKKFIKPDITLNKLAKRFHTNSKYLSLVIKHHRGKTFSNYINALKIDYAVSELKKNKKYKLYTLKAIANEFGFNSTESFSSAFYKNTGLKPSYFLKELHK